MKGGGARAGLSRRPIFRVKRMVGREVLREEVLEIGGAGLAVLALGVGGAGLIVEVARTGDVGVLEGLGPRADLAGAALGEGFQMCDFRIQGAERRAAFEEAEHGADFAGRAACDVEKGEQFVGGAALEAFRDVVGDGEGGAVELVAFGPGDEVFGGSDEILAAFGEDDGFLPDRELLEALIGGHGGAG